MINYKQQIEELTNKGEEQKQTYENKFKLLNSKLNEYKDLGDQKNRNQDRVQQQQHELARSYGTIHDLTHNVAQLTQRVTEQVNITSTTSENLTAARDGLKITEENLAVLAVDHDKVTADNDVLTGTLADMTKQNK